MPRALSDAEIKQTITDFGQATRRAIMAGFDGVEIHGANTYLIQQFFSPHSNRRTDDWGGSLEKRLHFPLAVIKEVETTVAKYANPPFIIGYRLSPEEREEPGITISDTLKLVDALKQTSIDYLHVSNNDVWKTSIRNPSDSAIINQTIKQQVDGAFPVIVVGGLKTPAEVERAAEQFDLVAMGLESIREPHWVQKVSTGDEASIRYAISPSELVDLGIQPAFLEMIKLNTGGAAGIPITTAN